MNKYRDYYSAIVKTENGLDIDVLELVNCELERQQCGKQPIIGMIASDIINEFKEHKFTWRDIVEINGKYYAEEFSISGIMENPDAYILDDFYTAVAEKYNVDLTKNEIKTYMMDNITFNPTELEFGAEDCGCYIDGEPEWIDVEEQDGRIMNTETKQEIIGIVMCHGENDYGYWGGFSLTEEEQEQIYEILMRHDTEGCSIRGTRNDIANEIRE